MSEDFMFRYNNQEMAGEMGYASIVRKIMNYGKNMDTDFPSMPKIDLDKVAKKYRI